MTDISIVIPAYNEEERIARCVSSALDELAGTDGELLVCDDGSTDATADICHDLARGTRLEVLENETNRGILPTTERLFWAASGDVILRIDADCTLDTGLVVAVLQAVTEGADIVYGPVAVKNTDRLHPAACAAGHESGSATRYGAACVAVRQPVVEMIGGLRQNIERELRYQADARGLTVTKLDRPGVESDFPVRMSEWLPRKYQSGQVYLREVADAAGAFRFRELRGPAFWSALVPFSIVLTVAGGLADLAVIGYMLAVLYLRDAFAVYSISDRPLLAVLTPGYRTVSGLARTAGVWAEAGMLGQVLAGKVRTVGGDPA